MNIGKDITGATNDIIKDLKNDIKSMQKKLDSIEDNTIKITNKVEHFADDIYNFIKSKIEVFLVLIILFLLFPHIIGIINFTTNLMILSKIKKIEN